MKDHNRKRVIMKIIGTPTLIAVIYLAIAYKFYIDLISASGLSQLGPAFGLNFITAPSIFLFFNPNTEGFVDEYFLVSIWLNVILIYLIYYVALLIIRWIAEFLGWLIKSIKKLPNK